MQRIATWSQLAVAAAMFGACGCGGGTSTAGSEPGDAASTALVTVPTTPGNGPQMTNSAIPGLVIAAPATVADPKDASKSYVTVKMLTLGQVITQKTASVATADAAKLTANLVTGNLVGYVPADLKTGQGVVVPSDPSMTFYKVLAKGTN